MNGRWYLQGFITHTLLVVLPAAVFVLLRHDDRLTAAHVGAFLGVGTLFLGFDTNFLPLQVLYFGHALSSFAVVAMVHGLPLTAMFSTQA